MDERLARPPGTFLGGLCLGMAQCRPSWTHDFVDYLLDTIGPIARLEGVRQGSPAKLKTPGHEPQQPRRQIMAFTKAQVVDICKKASPAMTKGLSDDEVYEFDQKVGKLRAFKRFAKIATETGYALRFDPKSGKFRVANPKGTEEPKEPVTLSEAGKILDKVVKALKDKEPKVTTTEAKAPAKSKSGTKKKSAAKKAATSKKSGGKKAPAKKSASKKAPVASAPKRKSAKKAA